MNTARILIALAATGTILGLSGILPHVQDGQALVTVRNSLIFDVGTDFDWKPERAPATFRSELLPAPESFRTAVHATLAAANAAPPAVDSFAVAVVLAKSLTGAVPRRNGHIGANTLQAYSEIVRNGRGMCSDFTQVFNGLAHAAGISVREWGMSFKDYGGNGHAFSEVYSTRHNKWLFLDTYNSFYVTDEFGTPESYLELRTALLAGRADALRLVPLIGRIPFHSDKDALEYYRRGAAESYLWMANDVFTYDQQMAYWSWAPQFVEQGIAIVLGLHPRILIDARVNNAKDLKELEHVRMSIGVTAMSSLALLALVVAGAMRSRASRPVT